VKPSHNAAGTKISPEPTTGTSEKKAMATPRKVARATSPAQSQVADCALNGCEDKAGGDTRGDKVPRLRHQRLSMFGIKR